MELYNETIYSFNIPEVSLPDSRTHLEERIGEHHIYFLLTQEYERLNHLHPGSRLQRRLLL
jgi:hypothetical protein